MNALPVKITPDAIKEALFEIRFEHGELAEVVLGRLAGLPRWSDFPKSRLPGADIPEQMRVLDVNLRHVPSLEIRASPEEVIRVGHNVLSHHNVGTYLGWDRFLPHLLSTTQALFEAVPKALITRLGFRYINVLMQREHHVDSLYDLDLRIEVKDRRPSPSVQLVYALDGEPDLLGLVRVITPNFVAEGSPPGSVALIDIDIYNDAPASMTGTDAVEAWLDRAHLAEKKAFFSLLKDETVKKLQEA